jgi:hypothetical protein
VIGGLGDQVQHNPPRCGFIAQGGLGIDDNPLPTAGILRRRQLGFLHESLRVWMRMERVPCGSRPEDHVASTLSESMTRRGAARRCVALGEEDDHDFLPQRIGMEFGLALVLGWASLVDCYWASLAVVVDR